MLLFSCCTLLLFSHVKLFYIPKTGTHQASLSFIIFQSLLKIMSIQLVMPSNHLILHCPITSCPKSFPALGFFPISQLFESGSQSTGASASASVLPMSIQDWFPLGLTGLISLLSKEISSPLQHQQFKRIKFSLLNPFFVQLSLPYITTGKTIALTIWTFVSKVMSLLFNILSRFVIAFLPRSKCLLISWLQSLSTVIHKTLHHLATHRHF